MVGCRRRGPSEGIYGISALGASRWGILNGLPGDRTVFSEGDDQGAATTTFSAAPALRTR